MRKIRISELPLATSLRGLVTLGTDYKNESVKVSLEFVEEAAESARLATANAVQATQLADASTKATEAAITQANEATANAQSATASATAATEQLSGAATLANEATAQATAATAEAQTATLAANTATNEAQQATNKAQQATELTLAAITRIVPEALHVQAPERLTYGNKVGGRITATLSPESVAQNILLLSDNQAVSVMQNGEIRILRPGRSTVQIVPSFNTSLTQTLVIEVAVPSLRLTGNDARLRVLKTGQLLLN